MREAVAFVAPATDGETDIAAIVEAESQAGIQAALMEICAERLPRFAWPARIGVRAALPRLPNGKIDRQRMAKSIERGRSGS